MKIILLLDISCCLEKSKKIWLHKLFKVNTGSVAFVKH